MSSGGKQKKKTKHDTIVDNLRSVTLQTKQRNAVEQTLLQNKLTRLEHARRRSLQAISDQEKEVVKCIQSLDTRRKSDNSGPISTHNLSTDNLNPTQAGSLSSHRENSRRFSLFKDNPVPQTGTLTAAAGSSGAVGGGTGGGAAGASGTGVIAAAVAAIGRRASLDVHDLRLQNQAEKHSRSNKNSNNNNNDDDGDDDVFVAATSEVRRKNGAVLDLVRHQHQGQLDGVEHNKLSYTRKGSLVEISTDKYAQNANFRHTHSETAHMQKEAQLSLLPFRHFERSNPKSVVGFESVAPRINKNSAHIKLSENKKRQFSLGANAPASHTEVIQESSSFRPRAWTAGGLHGVGDKTPAATGSDVASCSLAGLRLQPLRKSHSEDAQRSNTSLPVEQTPRESKVRASTSGEGLEARFPVSRPRRHSVCAETVLSGLGKSMSSSDACAQWDDFGQYLGKVKEQQEHVLLTARAEAVTPSASHPEPVTTCVGERDKTVISFPIDSNYSKLLPRRRHSDGNFLLLANAVKEAHLMDYRKRVNLRKYSGIPSDHPCAISGHKQRNTSVKKLAQIHSILQSSALSMADGDAETF